MDLEVLQYVIENEHENLVAAVDNSGSSLNAAIGVAKLLIANKGDTSVLKGKQIYVFEKCIKPIFEIACNGIYGDDTCTGNGFIDEESLLISYQEDEFLCQHCRFDSERIGAE